MPTLNVVVLAAGKGTRMFSDTPKVLHCLAGKPLLRHVIDSVRPLSPAHLCIVYGYGGNAVLENIQEYQKNWVKTDATQQVVNQLEIGYALQDPQLGTGHAVQQALPQLDNDGSTLVLYGDVPLIQSDTLLKMQNGGNGLTILTVVLENPTGYGRILRNEQGEVQRIIEEKDATELQRRICEVNTGILLAPTALLKSWLAKITNQNAQREYYLTDIVSIAVDAGVEVNTVQPTHEWEIHGINSKAQLARLERKWQAEEANRMMEKGVSLADPSRIDIRGKLTCGRDVEIDVGCIFEGHVTIGDKVKVGAYSIVKNSTILSNSNIKPYSLIEDSEIGDSCQIGPFARLRPGTKIHENAHVGNFVEIKNSEIGAKSKANHLSYIGDTVVGSGVNIGAGTITCNYDGVNKFQTIIEDDVFIGSDTQLIAPVRIRRGSTIGAGSTITRDTPENELSLSRSKQLSISGWQRPSKKII